MSEAASISVLICDDHPMLREGLRAAIEAESGFTVVGEAADGVEAVDRFRATRPDITLMDLQMPRMSGLEAINAIRLDDPAARIVVLTTYAGDVQALRALKAGAAGYLLKSTLRRELIDTVRSVHAGRRILQPEVAQDIAVNAVGESLTDREADILRMVASGLANKEIGRTLTVSEDAVKASLRNIFGKLDVTDRTQAVTVAVRRGIIAL